MVSKGWIKKLFEETKQWVEDGLIDSGQQARILARYPGRLEYRRLINTITTLGSILIGLGILLFVASNWDKLGRPVKIAIIFSVITLFHLASYYFRYIKKEYPYLAEGFILIGAFAFGAGVWLIAQIYQIHYNFSAGIIFWILGILPIVYIYRSWTNLCLASILSLIWLFSYHSYYPQREAYGFLPLLAVIVSLCYRQKQRFSLFMMVIGLVVWLGHFWYLKYTGGDYWYSVISQLLLVAIYNALGFILYGLGIKHARAGRFTVFSSLYKSLGVLFITLPAYSLTFVHHYGKYDVGIYPSAIIVLVALLFLTAASILFRLYRNIQDKSELIETRAAFCFLLLSILVVLISSNWPGAASLSFNIILLIYTLGFMYLGFIKHSEGIFRLSIAIFFLNVLSRYFDIFWKMLPRSLLFIFGGAILIFGAIFADRKRRQIEAKMRKP